MVKISQIEVLDFLKNNKGKYFTSKKIAERLGLNESSISSNIRRLGTHGLITRRVNPNNPTSVEYGYLHQESMIREKPLPVKELNEGVGE